MSVPERSPLTSFAPFLVIPWLANALSTLLPQRAACWRSPFVRMQMSSVATATACAALSGGGISSARKSSSSRPAWWHTCTERLWQAKLDQLNPMPQTRSRG